MYARIAGSAMWKDGFIKKQNFDYGGRSIPSSYTVKLDSKKKPVMNVISVNLRKTSQDDAVKMVSVVAMLSAGGILVSCAYELVSFRGNTGVDNTISEI